MASFHRAPIGGGGGGTGTGALVDGQPANAGDWDSGNDAPAVDDEGPARMSAQGAGRRSLSERYNIKVDAQTGAAACTIPIETTAGRAGAGPALSVEYGSGAATANGVFGMGWRLAGVDHIARKTLAVPTYDDDADTFFHSLLGDLVPADGPVKAIDGCQVREYRARVESQPTRIERWTASTGDAMFWRTISSLNVVTIYGGSEADQVFCSGSPKKILSWLASEEYDGRGNHVGYTYKAEDGVRRDRDVFEVGRHPSPQRYLKSIVYGNTRPSRRVNNWDVVTRPSEWLFEVVFDYGEHGDERPTTEEEYAWEARPDPFSACNGGFEVRTHRRCRRVLMFHHFPSELGRRDCLVSSTCFEYETDARSGASFLRSCVRKGHSPRGDADYWTVALPPVELAYTPGPASLADLPVQELDLRMSGLDTAAAQWIDLDGEGAPGVLTKAEGAAWYFQRNLSRDCHAQVGEPCLVATTPGTVQSPAADWHFEHVRMSGLLDVVVTAEDGSLRGFFEREEDGGWLNFVPFESYPVTDDPGAFRSVDLSGDGRADLLRMTAMAGGSLAWHPSRGPLGFGAEQAAVGAPLLSLEDPASLVQLCDMSGDGLADVVEIRNGSICYWPNMGHGTFGPKVVMGHAPHMAPADRFSPRRIRSADLTGSGTTDLIYVPPEGGAVVYYNRSGNDWSEGHLVPSFQLLGRPSAVDILDLAGQGAACLCWVSDLYVGGGAGSSGLSMVRYVNLSGRSGTGLLERWSNGMGLETTFTYRSSFSFYRDDEIRGTPWTTKLPFPLQCVERAVTVDHVAQTSSTARYAYHNGYYDHAERLFRGFQMVEMWDAENFLSPAASLFQRPPVLTRQWFYVGLEGLDRPSTLPWSYVVDTPRHALLASAAMSSAADDVAATEEAYRALAGRGRRTEVFSADLSDPKAALPYLISQQTYQVVLKQQSPTRLACRVDGREEITAHYERAAAQNDQGRLELSLDESRVQHRLTLQVDSHGNVLLEALVEYGKPSSQLLDPDDGRKQEETFVGYTERVYTNAVEPDDYFQIPLVAEVRKHRVFPSTRLAVGRHDRYVWETLAQDDAALFRDAVEIPAHADASELLKKSEPRGYRILLAEERTLYTSTDLRRPLPSGVLEAFSVVYQKYQLALTSSLLEKTLDGAKPALDAKTLTAHLKRGGYVELAGEESGAWWTQSTRPVFGDDDPDRRLEAARAHFYIPNGEVDTYGNMSTKKLDKYDLLVRSTTNALGSTTLFASDYAKLLTVMMTDPNKNRTQTAFDPLGHVIGVAVMGKDGGSIANSLNGFQGEMDQSTLEAFFKNPYGETARSLLAGASQRTIYDLDSYHRGCRMPARVAQLNRHEHAGTAAGAASRISVRISYLNGAGADIQSVLLSGEPDKGGKPTWDFDSWVIEDNKGQPVQKLQPFRASSHAFQRQRLSNGGEVDVPATTLLRDPLGRVVGVLYPDHSWAKTRFTPWARIKYNAGNTANVDDPAADQDLGPHFQQLARPLYLPTWRGKRMAEGSTAEEKQAARQSDIYAAAPTTTHLDALGRTILTEAGKGPDTRFTRIDYSARGHVSKVRDALGRTVETAQYGLLGQRLWSNNMDRGRRWLLPACDGLPLLSWSDRGTRRRLEYDALRRVKSVWTRTPKTSAAEIEVIRNIYGEGQPGAPGANLHGQLYRCYDQAGLLTNSHFDVLGGCAASTRRYADKFRSVLDWSAVTDEEAALETHEYTTKCRYNALGLPVEHVAPDLGVVRRGYDIAGRLRAVESLDNNGRGDAATSSTKNIEYNASSNITRIDYGDKSRSTNVYDRQTQRLVATSTVRTTDGVVLQDISYTYDCLAKVVQTKDKAKHIMTSGADSVSSTQEYRYDCLGQLVYATGRVQVSPESKQLSPYGFNEDRHASAGGSGGSKTIRHRETYTYDKAGNMLTMRSAPDGGCAGWTRTYTYDEPSCVGSGETSNRLTRTAVGGVVEEYRYEGAAGRHGCMTSIPGYSRLCWDDDDRLRGFSTQRVSRGGAIPETTWYVYDAEGTRVRKVTEQYQHGPGTIPGDAAAAASDDDSNSASSDDEPPRIKSKDTRYLPMGDIYSVYRGDGLETRRTAKTLGVRDAALGRAPVALVETTAFAQGATQTLTRYRLGDQLEIDDAAKMVSYYEYSPFGSQTYQSKKTDAPRVYRFASYRWDAESGLCCCGARYYAPWLGRWTSADPLGAADGLNLFAYVGNDPVNFDDPGGTTKTKKTPTPTDPDVPGPSHKGPPPVAEGHTRLWRGTAEQKASEFVDSKDLEAVSRTVRGDFNVRGEKASYWAETRQSAEAHAQYSREPGAKALIYMDVPTKMLDPDRADVHHYGRNVSPEWTEELADQIFLKRHNTPAEDLYFSTRDYFADRETAFKVAKVMVDETFDADGQEMARSQETAERIREERKADVTIGPEMPFWSGVVTEALTLDGRVQMQVAFKGDALTRLTGYRAGYVPYVGTPMAVRAAPRRWGWCQLL